MHAHLARFTAEEGVLFVGRAREKTSLFRTERRRDANGDAYPWVVRATGVVNQFYVYAVDAVVAMSTVRTHIRSILVKLEVNSQQDAIAIYRETRRQGE